MSTQGYVSVDESGCEGYGDGVQRSGGGEYVVREVWGVVGRSVVVVPEWLFRI